MTPAAEALPKPARGDLVVWCALARGRTLFNRHRHWEAHEAWEDAWRRGAAGDRALFRGLIQATAAFHKLLVQDNPRGAGVLLPRASAALRAAPDEFFGLDLPPFRAQLESWSRRLDAGEGIGPRPSGLPRLEWSASSRRWRFAVAEVALWRLPSRADGPGAILVALTARDVTGWGECRLAWDRRGAWDSLLALCPALFGEAFSGPSELPVLWSDVAASEAARAGLEAAAWDLFARAAGLPLAVALGLRARPVPLAAAVEATGEGEAFMARMISHVTEARARGYGAVIAAMRPNADRRVAAFLVERAGLPVAFDGGGQYGRQHFAALRAVAEAGASLLVAPFPDCDVVQAARLRPGLAAPLSVAAWDPRQVESGHMAGAMDVVHVDPGRSGITSALQIASFAESRGLPMWIASTASTPVGVAADLALACHPAVTLPSAFPLARSHDGEAAVVTRGDGTAEVPPGLGIGPVPSRKALDAIAVETHVLRG